MKRGWEKGKDADPRQTISTIQDICDDLHIKVRCEFQRPLSGIYTARIKLYNTSIGVSGKGSTKQYALASAYAELMERLQAQLLYTLHFYHQKPSTQRYAGFFVAPDEVHVPKKLFKKSLSKSLATFIGPELTTDLIDDYYRLEQMNGRHAAVFVPYFNTATRRTELMPHSLLKMLVGSNGFASGNTHAEAVVQSISEVIERHVNRSLLAGRQKTRSIPRAIIAKYAPSQAQVIGEIERSGITIDVFDASPYDTIPVIGICAQHRQTARYFVKVGVHPLFSIALERCLTELMQGYRSIRSRLESMMSFNPEMSIRAECSMNVGDMYRTGSAHYPPTFFVDRAPFKRREYFTRPPTSNVEMMNSYISTVNRGAGMLLMRDMSFLGFATVHAYVPFKSELLTQGKLHGIIREALQHHWSAMKIKDIRRLRTRDRKMFARELQNASSFNLLMNLPITRRHDLAGCNTSFFRAILHYSLGQVDSAFEAATSFRAECEGITDFALFADSLCSYISLIRHGVPVEAAYTICTKVYGSVCRRWRDIFVERSADAFFMPRMRCWRCSQCSYVNNKCQYPLLDALHRRLKRKYARWYEKIQGNRAFQPCEA